MTPPPTDPRSLQNLHDIVVPEGVPWWPPAPGWPVLAAIVLAAAAWLLVAAVRRHGALRYRREALAELQAIRARADEGEARSACARAAATLLKRTAIHAHSRERVAALNGGAWLRFLDEHGGAGAFRGGVGSALIEATYGASEALDADRLGALLQAVEGWVRAQRIPRSSRGNGPS